jgi:DNA polymerase
MKILTLDFETFFDVNFSLTKLTTMEYVNSDEFTVWGVGCKLDDQLTNWFSRDEVEDYFEEIDWANTAVVCHNTPFDAYILTQYYKVKPAYYYDTAAMSRGLYPGQSARLKDVAERLFPNDPTLRKGDELVTAKGIRDLPPSIEDDIAGYCIQDVVLTDEIFKTLLPRFPQKELDLINLTTRMFVEPKITLDIPMLEKHRDQHRQDSLAKIENSGTTRDVLASNNKFTLHLESLGIVVPTKKSPNTGKMIPAFSKTDVAYTQMCMQHPELAHVWEARQAVKSRIEETRADRFINSINKDGSFGVPLRYYAAHTGRFGGTEKINLQNLPRGSALRHALCSPPGKLLFIGDLSNIEVRMLAWLAKEADLIDAFSEGRDVYCEFASEIYGRPITKTDKLERYVGKTAILGLGYGMGWERFKYTLKTGSPSVDVTESTAKSIVEIYRGSYPNITRLWAMCKQLLFSMGDQYQTGSGYGPLTIGHNSLQLPNDMYLQYQNLTYAPAEGGFIYNSYKRTERLYGPKLTENIVQALARIVITDAMLKLDDVVLQVHDEIITCKATDTPEDELKYMLDVMTIAPDWCHDIPLAAEGGFSTKYNK